MTDPEFIESARLGVLLGVAYINADHDCVTCSGRGAIAIRDDEETPVYCPDCAGLKIAAARAKSPPSEQT